MHMHIVFPHAYLFIYLQVYYIYLKSCVPVQTGTCLDSPTLYRVIDTGIQV